MELGIALLRRWTYAGSPADGRATSSSSTRKTAASAATSLAAEIDAWQQDDAARMAHYETAAERYLAEFRAGGLGSLPLAEAHSRVCDIAERFLPKSPLIAKEHP